MHTQRDWLGGRERAEKKGRLAGVEAVGGGVRGAVRRSPSATEDHLCLHLTPI